MLIPPADRTLARRLEGAEARANVAFVEARAAAGGAGEWRGVGGAFAMFDGAASPLTQTFALGLADEPATEATLAALETFLRDRGAPVYHEVSPVADAALLPLLVARGYAPVEFTSVLYQPVRAASDAAPRGPSAAPGAVPVRQVDAADSADVDRWAETAALGWGAESAELGAFMREFGRVSARAAGTACFVAELDGEAVGAAAMGLHGGVALLAGASTRPAWRGRGAQAALLRARLAHAAAAGCDLAMMGAAPGSVSQRNAERQGFRVAYTRVKWHLPGG